MPIVCMCVKKIETVDTHRLRRWRYFRMNKTYRPIASSTAAHAPDSAPTAIITPSHLRQRVGSSTRTMKKVSTLPWLPNAVQLCGGSPVQSVPGLPHTRTSCWSADSSSG